MLLANVNSPAQWIELTCALGLQGKNSAAREAAKILRRLAPAFTADGFFDIAQRFYGKRFSHRIRAEYRDLCAALQRAM